MVSTCGEQFGQNGQKLHENYKINILGSKQTEGVGGQAPVGEILLRTFSLHHSFIFTRSNPTKPTSKLVDLLISFLCSSYLVTPKIKTKRRNS